MGGSLNQGPLSGTAPSFKTLQETLIWRTAHIPTALITRVTPITPITFTACITLIVL